MAERVRKLRAAAAGASGRGDLSEWSLDDYLLAYRLFEEAPDDITVAELRRRINAAIPPREQTGEKMQMITVALFGAGETRWVEMPAVPRVGELVYVRGYPDEGSTSHEVRQYEVRQVRWTDVNSPGASHTGWHVELILQ